MTLKALSKKDRAATLPQPAQLTGTRDQRSGQVVLLPHHDLSHYSTFIQGFFDEYAPQGPTETQLVQVIANSSWRLNRAHAWEDQILALEFQSEAGKIAPSNPPQVVAALGIASVVDAKIKELDKLSQYQARTSRQFSAALKELRMLQSKRLALQPAQMTTATRLLQMHEADDAVRQSQERQEKPQLPPTSKVAYDPKTDGFAFSLADLKTFIVRRERLKKSDDCKPLDSTAAG